MLRLDVVAAVAKVAEIVAAARSVVMVRPDVLAVVGQRLDVAVVTEDLGMVDALWVVVVVEVVVAVAKVRPRHLLVAD